MKSALSLKQLVLIAAVVLVGMQFVPVARTNPPVETPVVGPQPVMDVLRRACFECHSNETVWPWYARVAPVSWLVARDVTRGRAALNFSTWRRLGRADQDGLQGKIWDQIKNGDMPPPFYKLGHPDGQVTTDDQALLRRWCGRSSE